MARQAYYQDDLAWVHHAGYSHHVERTGPGIVQLLRDSGMGAGARVLDVGCGSGLLARELCAAGFAVRGVDASPAMIELAREYERGADFELVRLPTGLPPGSNGALRESDAVVSTGHASIGRSRFSGVMVSAPRSAQRRFLPASSCWLACGASYPPIGAAASIG